MSSRVRGPDGGCRCSPSTKIGGRPRQQAAATWEEKAALVLPLIKPLLDQGLRAIARELTARGVPTARRTVVGGARVGSLPPFASFFSRPI